MHPSSSKPKLSFEVIMRFVVTILLFSIYEGNQNLCRYLSLKLKIFIKLYADGLYPMYRRNSNEIDY